MSDVPFTTPDIPRKTMPGIQQMYSHLTDTQMYQQTHRYLKAINMNKKFCVNPAVITDELLQTQLY